MILCINSGSSSFKFAWYRMGESEALLDRGAVERIGRSRWPGGCPSIAVSGRLTSTDTDSAAFPTSIVQALGRGVDGRVIVAHLGNGASMAALKNGRPRDTSMGFSAMGPHDGHPIRRSGSGDPALPHQGENHEH